MTVRFYSLGVKDHSKLANLLADSHTQYALLLGRAGGQNLAGDNAANGSITIRGTSNTAHATSLINLLDHIQLAAGKNIKDSGGTDRISLSTGSPNLTLTGDAYVNGLGAIGGSAISVLTNTMLTVGNTGTPDGVIALQALIGSQATPGAGNVISVGGYCLAKNVSTTLAIALDYLVGQNGLTGIDARGIRLQHYSQGVGKNIANAYGVYFRNPLLVSGTVSSIIGYYSEDLTNAITGVSRFLQFGTDPIFMVKTKKEWAPTANQTGVWMAEGVTPTSRQVQWKLFSALVAGDRVMVLV